MQGTDQRGDPDSLLAFLGLLARRIVALHNLGPESCTTGGGSA